MIFLGIFPCVVKDIILCEVRLNPGKVRLKRTSENSKNSETQKNSNFLCGWRGPLVMMLGGVGAGGVVSGPDGGGVSGSRRGNGREPDGVGEVVARRDR